MSYQHTQNNRQHHNRPQRERREPQEIERPVSVTLQTLLESGSHFGTNSESRNPNMIKFIYGMRNGVYIINLDKTLEMWDLARKAILDTISTGGDILFVGTKRQVKELVKVEASNCGAHYVTEKWLGGTLTNLEVIRKTITRIDKLENLLTKAEKGDTVILTKKEKLDLLREVDKLNARLGGLRDMKKLPSLVFITDPVKDDIAVQEARRMNIPIIAISDTDSDPDLISFPIPANDDGASALALFVRAVSDAVLEGKNIWQEKLNLAKDKQDQIKLENTIDSELTADFNLAVSEKSQVDPNLQVVRKKNERKVEITQQS